MVHEILAKEVYFLIIKLFLKSRFLLQDSGGGLFVNEYLKLNQSRYFVSGIVSYGDGCARVGKPGIKIRKKF